MAGAPSLYDEKYCDALIAHCAEGLSFESFAGLIGVTRSTIYLWRKEHQPFSDAADIAKESCRKYWEEKGRDGTIGELEKFNGGTWQFIMKNFFRDEWSDTYIQKNEGAIAIHSMSDEEWYTQMVEQEIKHPHE